MTKPVEHARNGRAIRISVPPSLAGMKYLPALPASPHDTRNHLPAMPPIDPEVRIRRHDHWISHGLGHANHAGLSQAHRYARVFLQQREHRLQVAVEIEHRNHGSPRKHRTRSRRAAWSKQAERLRECCFAAMPGRHVFGGLLHGPSMVEVAATQKRHQETRINHYASGHSSGLSGISSFVRSGRPPGHPRNRSSPRYRLAGWRHPPRILYGFPAKSGLDLYSDRPVARLGAE